MLCWISKSLRNVNWTTCWLGTAAWPRVPEQSCDEAAKTRACQKLRDRANGPSRAGGTVTADEGLHGGALYQCPTLASPAYLSLAPKTSFPLGLNTPAKAGRLRRMQEPTCRPRELLYQGRSAS